MPRWPQALTTSLAASSPRVQRPGLERSLGVVARLQTTNGIHELLRGYPDPAVHRVEIDAAGWTSRPYRFDPRPNRLFETGTYRTAFRSVAGERAVERENLNGTLLHRHIHGIERALGRRGDETEDKCSHRRDQPDADLHRVLGIAVEMMLRQDAAQPHSQQSATEGACEDDYADNRRVHSPRFMSGVDAGSVPGYAPMA